MTAINILCDGTIRAALLILTKNKGVASEAIDCGALAGAVKLVLKDRLSIILAEWKDAAETSVGEAWLQELVNAQCNECGLLAVNVYLKREVA